MKGQAFVTFPSIDLAREALTTVNGFIFKEKPIVVVGVFFCSMNGSVLERRVSFLMVSCLLNHAHFTERSCWAIS